MDTPTYAAIHAWLIERVEGAADWRANVAQRFPDDDRNETSRAALLALAQYLRTMEFPPTAGLDEPLHSLVPSGLLEIFELARRECRSADVWAEMPWGENANRAVGRFGFGRSLRPIDAAACAAVLGEIADGVRRDLEEAKLDA